MFPDIEEDDEFTNVVSWGLPGYSCCKGESVMAKKTAAPAKKGVKKKPAKKTK